MVRLDDYAPPERQLKTVHLTFQILDDHLRVECTIEFHPTGKISPLSLPGPPCGFDAFVIHGPCENATLLDVRDTSLLEISEFNDAFPLITYVSLKPEENTDLEGLFKSNGIYVSHCEPDYFHKITFFPDRPDVQAVWTVRIEAPARYNTLLSNGNLTSSGTFENDTRHWAEWHDPWRKPCYLFAIVVGDLAVNKSTFTTASGKVVELGIYTEHVNAHKTEFAMASLKQAMKWDEDRFGLEYDLNTYNIVAVDDFTSGAMENKGLNIFNSKYVLATPDTATDANYYDIAATIAHEYFHNFTGNRVTCRDWFQLSIKEGLTVYRDQEFRCDTGSATARLEQIRFILGPQMSEDSGPTAHPIRPVEYDAVNNLYTPTVYEKGAEVIRLYETVLGRKGFRAGLMRYLKENDGRAATAEEFYDAMAVDDGECATSLRHAPGIKQWYNQAGTPTVTVYRSHDRAAQTYTLRCVQTLPKTPDAEGNKVKLPQLIPLRTSFFKPNRPETWIPTSCLSGISRQEANGDIILFVTDYESTFVFRYRDDEILIPCVNVGFSAPVKVVLDPPLTQDEMLSISEFSTDQYTRWSSVNEIIKNTLLDTSKPITLDSKVMGISFPIAGQRAAVFQAIAAECLSPIGVNELLDICHGDPVELWKRRETYLDVLAVSLYPWSSSHLVQYSPPYAFTREATARRYLRNELIFILSRADITIAQKAMEEAHNMTDEQGAFFPLATYDWPGREATLDKFYTKWQHDPSVVIKWLSISASCPLPGGVERVRKLIEHPAFKPTTPNHWYAVIFGFCGATPCFHAADGSGYKFVVDQIIKINAINKSCAGYITDVLTCGHKLDPQRNELIKAQLQRLLETPDLSEGAKDICLKSLK